jgi:hypothetical protein
VYLIYFDGVPPRARARTLVLARNAREASATHAIQVVFFRAFGVWMRRFFQPLLPGLRIKLT